MILKQGEGLGLAGIHTFTIFDPVTKEDNFLMKELEKWATESPEKMRKFIEKCEHLIVDKIIRKNITVTAGREWMAKILCNTSSQTNDYVTHFIIGDDASAATVGDTDLGNELFRKAVSSAAEDGATANISTFIAASEANFDWEEWGHVVDGTATTDSGVMLSHHIDSTVSKSSPNTVTVDSVYTLSDV